MDAETVESLVSGLIEKKRADIVALEEMKGLLMQLNAPTDGDDAHRSQFVAKIDAQIARANEIISLGTTALSAPTREEKDGALDRLEAFIMSGPSSPGSE